MQKSFLQNLIMGLILVGYFASHVIYRKQASYKSVGNFPTKFFLGTNWNTTFEQEIFLKNAGKFSTHE